MTAATCTGFFGVAERRGEVLGDVVGGVDEPAEDDGV